MKSAVFGQVIVLIVYIPIFALVGVEGKMFRPMAFTVSFAIIGALLLSLTYVPWATSIFLNKQVPKGESWSERMIHRLERWPRTIHERSSVRCCCSLGQALFSIAWAASSFRNWMKGTLPPISPFAKGAT